MAKIQREVRVASDDASERNDELATRLQTQWAMDEIERIDWVDTPAFKGWRATLKED